MTSILLGKQIYNGAVSLYHSIMHISHHHNGIQVNIMTQLNDMPTFLYDKLKDWFVYILTDLINFSSASPTETKTIKSPQGQFPRLTLLEICGAFTFNRYIIVILLLQEDEVKD